MLYFLVSMFGCLNGDCENLRGQSVTNTVNLTFDEDLPVFSWIPVDTAISDGMYDMRRLEVSQLLEPEDTSTDRNGSTIHDLESGTTCDGHTSGSGRDVWIVRFSEEVPTKVPYGELPEGASEESPALELVDEAWYELNWSGCRQERWYWKQGDPDSALKVRNDCE
jgi:hypothetical protein